MVNERQQSKESMVKPPAKPPITFGYHERNLGRLNTVLGLNRVAGLRGWHKQIIVDDLGPIDLTCASTLDVPHGLDADILFAIQTAFELQGRPVDRVVKLTMPQLCELACLEPSGFSYKRIKEGLERLLAVNYKAEACWGRETRRGHWKFWTNLFGLVEDVKAVDLEREDKESKEFNATTILEIALNRNVVPSMREGFIRALSYSTANALNQPLSRLMYRTLEEQRPEGSDTFRVPLIAWGEHLGMLELDPKGEKPNHDPKLDIPATKVLNADRIRRALNPAHEDLKAVGYLRDVVYEGRGKKSEVVYTFSGLEPQPVNQELLKRFAERGVTPASAEGHIRSKGEDAAANALAILEARLEAGYKPDNQSGLLIDILKNPEKYANPSAAPSRETPKKEKKKAVPTEEATPEPPRLARSGLLAFGKMFDDTQLRRDVRDQAVAAFVAGQLAFTDLVEISQKSDAELAEWLSRSIT